MATTLKEYIRESVKKYLPIIKSKLPEIVYIDRASESEMVDYTCNKTPYYPPSLQNVQSNKKVIFNFGSNNVRQLLGIVPLVDCVVKIDIHRLQDKYMSIQQCLGGNYTPTVSAPSDGNIYSISAIYNASANTELIIRAFASQEYNDNVFLTIEVMPI